MLSFYEGFEFNFLLRVCPIYCMYMEVHVPQHRVWRSQNNFVKSVLAFYFYTGSRDGTQATGLASPFCFLLHLIVYLMC